MKETVSSFEIKVYCGKSNEGICEYETKVYSALWQQYSLINLAGFDGSVSLSLGGVWEKVIQSKLSTISEVLTGYETIVKYGATQQIKIPYFVELIIEYDD